MNAQNQSAVGARAVRRGFFAFLLPALIFSASCRTTDSTPPPADFSAPGWRVLHGQAVWKPARNRPELAGDLLLATNANGNCFIQFSKIPFPLATAQISDGRWQIEFGAGENIRRGHGAPPERSLWFQLPRALRAEKLAAGWEFSGQTNSWRLENPRTGEFLEGGFFP